MVFSQKTNSYMIPDVSRISALADGIFAIAMTLLVFNINTSGSIGLSGYDLQAFIIKDLPAILGYFVSFWVIGIYWRTYNRMLRVSSKLNGFLIQAHLAFLMLVAFIPFPTALVSQHPHDILVVQLYTGTLTLAGALLALLHWYLLKHPTLVKEWVSSKQIRLFFARSIVPPLVFVTSPFLARYIPDYVIFSWIAIYPIVLLVERYHESHSEQYPHQIS